MNPQLVREGYPKLLESGESEQLRQRTIPENGMGLRNWTWKIFVLAIIGSAITILFMISLAEYWKYEFRRATWHGFLGAALAIIFFRRRKIAFAITALSFLVVNVGLAALFHPTAARLLVTFSSVAAMYALAFGEQRSIHILPINTGTRCLMERRLWPPRIRA
jgi:hypothetical protein